MFQNIWYQVGRFIVALYVRFVMRADIHQPTIMPKGAKIFVVNHPCTNDPAFVTVLTKEQTTILIKETLFKVPLFGRSLRMAGHVPVVAGKGKEALEVGISLVKAGRTVIIFPEGEISPENGFHKAHSGAARLALATGAPVIPIGISLNYQRRRDVHTIVDGKRETSTWYLRGPYAMTVGNAISFQGDLDDRAQVHAVTDQLMRQVSLLCQHGKLRMAQRAMLRAGRLALPRRVLGAPKTAAQFAWRGTWSAFQHSTRMVMASPLFKTVESALVVALMYVRHFYN
jgi:1-acyl-sn-glycerol-3-phosphate acyltransferase